MRIIRENRSGLLSLLFFLLITAFVGIAALADGETDKRAQAAREAQDPPPAGDKITYPSDICAVSGIRDNAQKEFTRSPDSPLAAALDGNPGTYVTKGMTPDQWLEIRFPGPGSWINIIEIEYTGSDKFEFEAFNFAGDLREVRVISKKITEIADSRMMARIEIDPVRAKGFRWSPAADAPADGQVAIHDVKMQWFWIDPDTPDSINWLLCENIWGMGTADMAPLWFRIITRPAWAAGPFMPHWSHWWNGWAAWSGDFRVAPIGSENLHPWPGPMWYTGMDYHDLSVVALHGSPGRMQFPGGIGANNPLFQAMPPWNDHFMAWGNRDADWFSALSCSVYRWPWGAFWMARGFNGLHLQTGFMNPAAATGGAFLGRYARLMTAWPWWGVPITHSWFLASWATQPWGVKPIVLADLVPQFWDHLWGYGPVWNDGAGAWPHWAILDPPFSIEDDPYREFPPPLTPEQQQMISMAFTGPTAKSMPATTSFGASVRTTDELLKDGRFAPAMTVYELSPIYIDSQYVQDLADDLCANYGIMCAPEIGQDDDGNWSAVEDSLVIWSNQEYGYVQFVNIDDYLAIQTVEPSIPTPSSAITTAEVCLADLGITPTGSYSTETSYNSQAAFEDGPTIIPDSSFDLSLNVGFLRDVDGNRVFGPGGYIVVTVGEGSAIQHFMKGGWQDLINPQVENVITANDAITLLNTLGEDATIGGIPPIYDELVIDPDSTELAYYNTNGEYETDILEPIYHFYCYAISEDDTVATDIYVPARESKLRGFIDSPSDGSSFPEGQSIQFTALATGGTGSYTFTWFAENAEGETEMGTGQSIGASLNMLPESDTAGTKYVITLQVEDSGTGEVAYAQMGITIEGIGKIPTLSEWGLIVFSLLILTLITVVVVRRRLATVAAGAGGTISTSSTGPLFFPAIFFKSLTATLGLAVAVLIAAIAVSGTLPLRDIAGSLISAAIVAYIAHLWIVSNRE